MDRHHYEVYDFPEEWQNDTMPVILDNGRGYVSYCILFLYNTVFHTSLRCVGLWHFVINCRYTVYVS